MSPQVSELCHYPIKGLSAQTLESVTLRPGEGFPLDRVFGFARHNSGFDPANPRPLPKSKFVVLARDAALATLETHYDVDKQTLTVKRMGETAEFDITDPMARDVLVNYLSEHVGLPADERPSLQSATPHRFTDVSVVSPEMMNAVSLINIDSVAAFSERLGQDISPGRFRGNILFSGMQAFAEFDLIGKEIRVGAALLKVVQRTRRCPATEVNLETGVRDVDVPAELEAFYGHRDMGVYAHVVSGGLVKPGDSLEID